MGVVLQLIQSMRFPRRVVAVIPVIALLASACGGTAAPSPAASAAPATAAASAGLFGATVNKYEPLSNSDKWVVWNKTSCKYEETKTHPDKWVSNLRKPTGTFILGHQIQSEDNPINLVKNQSVKDSAELAGLKYVGVNGKYPDQAAMVAAAESIVTQGAQAVVEDQPLSTLTTRLHGIYAGKCIPFVQISLRAPDAVTVGASNAEVGKIEGEQVADYAKKQGWKLGDMFVVRSNIPSLAEINDRVTGCSDSIAKAFPGVRNDGLNLQAGTVAETQTVMTNWLTAHPDAKNVLGCTISGLQAVGMDNALTAAGRNKDAAVSSTGNTQKDLNELPKGTAIIGSVDFNWAGFGPHLVAILESAVSGEPIPEFVTMPVKFLSTPR